jgi:hypothetical protein
LYDRLASNGYYPHHLERSGRPGAKLSVKEMEKIEWTDIVAIALR